MTPVHIVHEAQQSPQGAQPKLQAGSVVQARVLAQTGAGQYVISLAGQKIAVRSETPLAQGAVFSAKIGVRGEQVILSLAGEQGEAKPLVTQFTASALQNGMDAALSQLLASLGLPASAESFRLLQFAQAMGIKIDPRQLRKALAAANQAGGGEEAAQTALVLDEKGLDASADALKAVANGFGGRGQGGADGGDERGEQQRDDDDRRRDEGDREREGIADDDASRARQDGTQNAETPPPPADARAALSAELLSAHSSADSAPSTLIQDYFASVDEAAAHHTIGALTLFNMARGSARTDSYAAQWIMLPFEWEFRGFSGVIRLLWSETEKKLSEIAINVKNSAKKYDFVVYLKEGQISSAHVSTEPALSDADGAAFCAQFRMVLGVDPHIPVTYEPVLSGFCTDTFPVSIVRGEA